MDQSLRTAKPARQWTDELQQNIILLKTENAVSAWTLRRQNAVLIAYSQMAFKNYSFLLYLFFTLRRSIAGRASQIATIAVSRASVES